MKFWVLAFSLFMFGCGNGESGSSEDTAAADAVEDNAASIGGAAAEALNEAQAAAEAAGDAIEDSKKEIDEELQKAEDAVND